MRLKFYKYLGYVENMGLAKYCFKKNVLKYAANIHNIHVYNTSIKTVAKMIVHALIIPQSTKKVKNLKFDFVTL